MVVGNNEDDRALAPGICPRRTPIMTERIAMFSAQLKLFAHKPPAMSFSAGLRTFARSSATPSALRRAFHASVRRNDHFLDAEPEVPYTPTSASWNEKVT